MSNELSREEQEFIQEARQFLENESVLIKIANLIGKPFEIAHKSLPKPIESAVNKAVDKSLTSALNIALKTSSENLTHDTLSESLMGISSKRKLHNTLTGITGAAGGFFGHAGLALELPITTTLIMRNIIEVGSQYEGIRQSDYFALQCLEVFTLGSPNNEVDDSMNSSYYASRAGLSKLMSDGASYLASHSAKVAIENAKKGSAAPLLNIIAKIAGRFKIVITEKMLAEAIPIVGALGGAAINIAFTDYYAQASKYHFGIVYLENKYGRETIQNFYEDLSNSKNQS